MNSRVVSVHIKRNKVTLTFSHINVITVTLNFTFTPEVLLDLTFL